MSRRLVAFAAALAAGVAMAQGLPADLQAVVALLQPADRARLEARAQLWHGWSPAQRDAYAARVADWNRLPYAERAERRAAWAAWRDLPASEQARLSDAATRHALLDRPQQQALRDAFDALDASDRHGWRLGPVLGVHYPRLQPLLAQVPADQQAGLLRTLRAMTFLERDKLAVLLERTPPQEREELRRELVSTSDANRAAWLMLRLER